MVKMICTRVVHAREPDGEVRLHATFREWDPPPAALTDPTYQADFVFNDLDFEPEVGDFYDLTPDQLERRLPPDTPEAVS
jgi:hypothetical protein